MFGSTRCVSPDVAAGDDLAPPDSDTGQTPFERQVRPRAQSRLVEAARTEEVQPLSLLVQPEERNGREPGEARHRFDGGAEDVTGVGRGERHVSNGIDGPQSLRAHLELATRQTLDGVDVDQIVGGSRWHVSCLGGEFGARAVRAQHRGR